MANMQRQIRRNMEVQKSGVTRRQFFQRYHEEKERKRLEEEKRLVKEVAKMNQNKFKDIENKKTAQKPLFKRLFNNKQKRS